MLFVDDAHKLPLASLKFIIELAMQGKPLTRMRVVLFCEPQITSILATPEFEIVQKNMTHTLDIPAFSATGVRDYLQFRLHGSQYSNFHPFTSDVIKKIHTESEGIPGEINLYAGQILQQFAEQRQEPIHLQSLSYLKLLWGIPILLILIGIAWFFYFQTPQSHLPQTIETSEIPVALPTPALYDHASIPQPILETGATDLSNHDSATVSTNSSLSELISHSDKPVPHSDFTLPNQIGQTEINGKDWLRRQNPNAYTLQVLGVYDRLTLKKFIAQNNLNEVAMFKTIYHDKDWYVLVYGIYQTRAQAEAALTQLPASLRNNTQPWARSLKSIQKLIKE
ncbi:MAG: hypothetical protein DRQ41_15570 [Gammaproteobacteria bacterium]|nr:MAG: hypothetical protein DRQ41_15570 [Gammaproteobacteria bacterium]